MINKKQNALSDFSSYCSQLCLSRTQLDSKTTFLLTERPCLNTSKNALNNYSSKQNDDSDLNFIRKLGFKGGLLICSLNAPSLTKHKDEIEVLVRDNKIDIFTINETKLDEKIKDERVSIVGYNLLRRDRNRHGGGVAIFLRETLNFEHRTDIKAENLEIICIEIKPKCSKPFFVLAWYRPPNYETETLEELNDLLELLDKESKEISVIGDVNCNDLDLDGKNKILVKLRNLYSEYQLKQLIKNPTRSTLTSRTLIDHFATNKPRLITNSGVFTTGFSDHDLILELEKSPPN